MGKDGFRELRVWQLAKELAVAVYRSTEVGQIARDFGLRDQMRRAAVSVPSNIAEGDERDTNKDSVRFLYIAKGSLAELRTQLEIAREVGSLSAESCTSLEVKCAEVGRMLGALIKARSTTHHP
ncbi:MAG: four helix bundle protein [Opitutaceae bacterium]|nr:four helix bundle protein [Opitutaceae bacterium]